MEYNNYVKLSAAGTAVLKPTPKVVAEVIPSIADAYGTLAGIPADIMGDLPDVALDRICIAMDSIAEGLATLGIDIKNYKIK